MFEQSNFGKLGGGLKKCMLHNLNYEVDGSKFETNVTCLTVQGIC